MAIPREIAEMAYEVRTGRRTFKSVPEAERTLVAAAMRRMRTADYQQIGDARRLPRGGGYGEYTASRVN